MCFLSLEGINMWTKQALILFFCVIFLFGIVQNPTSNFPQPIQKKNSPEPMNIGTTAYGEPWLNDFPYRKYHIINGSTGAGTNYQVRLRVRSGSGTDSGDLVNLDSSHWLVNDPLRFTDDDGVTLLDYYRESINGNIAVYWFEVKDSLENNVMIYIYYGNSTAPNLSNGSATFLAWDDFDDGYSVGDSPKVTRNWETQNLGASDEIKVANNPDGSGKVMKMYSDGAGDSIGLRNSWTNLPRVAVHYQIYIDTRPSVLWDEIYSQTPGGGAGHLQSQKDTSNYELICITNSGWAHLSPSFRPGIDTWYSMVILLNNTMSVQTDGTIRAGDVQLTATTWGNSQWQLWGTNPSLYYFDNFFVTKWVFNEPGHGAYGPEETDTTPPVANSVPWLENFPYRRAHSIEGSPGAGTNYQVEIQVHSGVGTDSGNLVNLPRALWTTADPVRFTDNDGITLLDYWKESSDNDIATYWVEVKDNLDFNAVIYLYYGNNTQPSLSNGTATFLFFDDFENGNLNRWDNVGSQWSVTTSDQKYGTYSAHYDGLVQSDIMSVNLSSFQSSIMIHSWYKPESALRGGFYKVYTSVQGKTEVMTAHDYFWQYYDGSVYTKYSNNASVTTPTHWDRCELGIDLSNYQMMLWVNRTFIGAASHIYDVDGNNITQSETIYQVELAGQYNWEHWADDFYIRKWIYQEPIHIGWTDNEVPSIDSPKDLAFDQGYSENATATTITWHPFDSFPALYRIYDGETLVRSGLWNSSSEEISISVQQLDVGKYNYSLEVIDTAGQKAVDYVSVDVLDVIPPTISAHPDVFYNEGETGNVIEWDPDDLHPYNYSIYRDYVLLRTGLWNSTSENISINVDGLSPGIYNYVLRVMDLGSNLASDNVTVTVYDITNPTLNAPEDIIYSEGSTDNQISWIPFDLNPSSYAIYQNSSVISSGAWNSSTSTINMSVDGLALGVYNYTIVVVDVGENTAIDTVFVTVIDDTFPTLDSPIDIEYGEGSIGKSVTWNATDLHLFNYTILKDGEVVKSGLFNASSELVSANLDGLGLGIYNYTIIVMDTSGNTANDTVFVTIIDSTDPILDSPPDATYNETDTGITITWNPYDLHPSNYTILKDGLQIKSGLWNSSAESISISLDGLGLGIYNYTIIVVDTSGNTANDTVMITIRENIPPIVTHPENQSYELGSIGHELSWILNDANPFEYRIIGNGTTRNWTTWSDGENITLSIDGLDVGTYEFSIEVRDLFGNNITDVVYISVVDTTAPGTDTPSDLIYELGSIGNNLTWSVSEFSLYHYRITGNGTTIGWSEWSNATFVTIPIDGLSVGIYNYTLEIADYYNNTASDIIIVTVQDTTPPIILSPEDVLYELGTYGNSINWSVMEYDPWEYEVIGNGSIIPRSLWNQSNVEVNIDGLLVGVYNYTIVFYDGTGNSAQDTVIVSVVDTTAPMISSPADILYQYGTNGNQVEWNATELDPAFYELVGNGTLIGITPWNGSKLIFNIDGYNYGIYNLTLILWDNSGNWANDTIIVTVVDTEIPLIAPPPDIYYEMGTTGHSITWSPSDADPMFWIVTLDGVTVDSDIWNGGQIIQSVDNLGIGIYNWTLFVNDTSGNWAIDTVIVSVVDTTPPLVDNLSEQFISEGSTGNIITWSPQDLNPYSYIIRINESLYSEALWNGSKISLVFDGFPMGLYNVSLVLNDTSGNIAWDWFWMHVQDTTSPNIIATQNVQYELGRTGYTVNWTATDLHPMSYEIFLDSASIESDIFTSPMTISLSVDGLNVGVHNLTLVTKDTSNNIRMSTVIVTVTPDITPPTISSPADVVFIYSITGYNVTWLASDINRVSYRLLMNGSIYDSGLWDWEEYVFDLDTFSAGFYNFTLVVTDYSGLTAADTVFVTIHPNIAPIIHPPADIQSSEDASIQIVWVAEDVDPSNYRIERDGALVDMGVWDGSNIIVDLSDLAIGTYSFTLTLWDDMGNSAFDIVLVQIIAESTPPSITHPADSSYLETGSLLVSWDVSDTHPSSYLILVDGVEVDSGSWDGTSISYTISGLRVGTHNITLVVYDLRGNWAEDTIMVSVLVDMRAFMTRTALYGGFGVVLPIIIIGSVVVTVRRRRRRSSIVGYVEEKERIAVSELAEFFALSTVDVLGFVESSNQVLLTQDKEYVVSTKVIVSECNKSLDKDRRIKTAEFAKNWGITKEQMAQTIQSMVRPTYELNNRDFIDLKALNESLDSQLSQTGKISSREYLQNWDISGSDLERVLLLSEYSVLKNNVGDFISIEQVMRDINERLSESGGFDSREIAERWGITIEQVLEISSELDSDLLRFESGRVLSRAYARDQIINLLEEDGMIHITMASRKLGLRKEETETLLPVVGSQVFLTESGMLILMSRAVQDIRNRLTQTGQVQAEEISEVWGLSASEMEGIVAKLDTRVLRMKTGGFMTFDHIKKEIIQVIQSKGELNPGGLAARLELDDSDIRSVISGMSLDTIESEKGVLFSTEHISNLLSQRLSNQGVVDFRVMEKDLGVSSARLLLLAKKTLGSKYRILEDALIMTTQKWLDAVRSEALQSQKVHLSSFASDHGVTEDGLLVVLQKLVSGSIDKDYGLFVVDAGKEKDVIRPAKAETVNVEILRGGEFIGNRFRFKVKIVNRSDTIITDVSAVLTTYPRESLKVDDERPRFVSKIEPGGFRSLPFEFTPTQDCVKGHLVSTVSYMDSRGNAYSDTTEPFEIRAVCDLLIPEAITPQQFQTTKTTLETVDLSDSVDGWSPPDMEKKVEKTLRENNFFDVSKEDSMDGFRRTGWAKGKYTGMHVGAEVTVTPKPGKDGSIIHLKLSGEDAAMLMPAMDELKRKLNPWNCPVCFSKLDEDTVKRLKNGETACCSYCGTTLTQ